MHLRWKLLLFGVLVDVTLVGSESPLSLHSQGLSTCANYMHKDIRILALTGVYLCFCTLLPRGLFQLTPLWTRRFNIHFHNCHLTVESLSTYQIQFETILSPTRLILSGSRFSVLFRFFFHGSLKYTCTGVIINCADTVEQTVGAHLKLRENFPDAMLYAQAYDSTVERFSFLVLLLLFSAWCQTGWPEWYDAL